jgi:hypothetical protein
MSSVTYFATKITFHALSPLISSVRLVLMLLLLLLLQMLMLSLMLLLLLILIGVDVFAVDQGWAKYGQRAKSGPPRSFCLALERDFKQ